MRWKCHVAYDGTDYEGWQSQPSGMTIQDFIEKRLAYLMGKPTRIHGSGRTDAGVHARGQVFHFDGEWRHGPEALIEALRVGYPDSIQVYRAEEVGEAFHARYSATNKRYSYAYFEGWASPFENRYCLSLRHLRLDTEVMNAAAATLLGRHDFSAFGANAREDKDDDPVKDLRILRFDRVGPRVTLTTEASGYLYKMVRSLAGCFLDIGSGRLDPAELGEILGSRVRTNRVVTAPAGGLCLERVDYGPEG